jgi:S1-C subfamily serine protease
MIKNLVFLVCSFVTISTFADNKNIVLRASTPSKLNLDLNSKTVSSTNKYDIPEYDDLPLSKASSVIKNIKPDNLIKTRSVKDIGIYKDISPAVVLIVTKDALGSGSIVSKKGEVLTNYHVIENSNDIGVIFKPAKDTDKIDLKNLKSATVLKVDESKDLALIRINNYQSDLKPIKFGDSNEISIGADVHAIGHPEGQSWSYTKGVISQFRHDFSWLNFKANVIQTQTPINPGNSGGPLISDQGTLIGVNSFTQKNTEGINFAISIDDVKKFILNDKSVFLPKKPTVNNSKLAKKDCKAKELFNGETKDKSGTIYIYDNYCDGKSSAWLIVPYDVSKPSTLDFDRNEDGKSDLTMFSFKSNGKWDLSYYDDNFDGIWDYVGYHSDGSAKATSYDDYKTFLARLDNYK